MFLNYTSKSFNVGGESSLALNNLIGAAIGVMILIIVMFSVTIPTVTEAIATANLTGAASTIAGLIPLLLVLGIFIIIVSIFVTRWL